MITGSSLLFLLIILPKFCKIISGKTSKIIRGLKLICSHTIQLFFHFHLKRLDFCRPTKETLQFWCSGQKERGLQNQFQESFLKYHKHKMKIFLDDRRNTPNGFIRTRTVKTTIELLKWNNGNIDTVSLDNDLGKGLTEGRMVARWIEEQAFLGLLDPIPNLIVHSDNNVARNDMMRAFENAKKYWENNK